MNDVMGMDHDSMVGGGEDWRTLADLMDRTSADLAAAPVGGLAPSVRGAARSFLDSWAGYADESSEIATGFATALDSVRTSTEGVDTESAGAFGDLDAHLGVAR